MAITLPMIKKEIDDLKSNYYTLEKLVTNILGATGSISPDLSDTLDQIMDGIKKIGISPNEAEIKLIQGNEITSGKYEAKLEIGGRDQDSIFPVVGYYFYDNKIYIYDHFKPEVSIDLPPQYHFLKIIKTEEDEYKLAFCNSGGNEYHALSDNLKLLNTWNLKSTDKIDFAKYYNKNGSYPSFILKASDKQYLNSQQYGVDVYQIGNGEKKIGSLVDEFGYYDNQNKFHYLNHHLGTENHSYDPLSFTVTKGDNQCSFHQVKEGISDIDVTNNNVACSLVEYIANYVNDIYF